MFFSLLFFFFFFFNDTATTEIYTLSLHDALPISLLGKMGEQRLAQFVHPGVALGHRSEEHTSELQSQSNLVCRLLLEKKKTRPQNTGSNHAGSRLQTTTLQHDSV